MDISLEGLYSLIGKGDNEYVFLYFPTTTWSVPMSPAASWGPFYLYWLTLIPAWISNYMPSKMWNEITYPFPNFNHCIIEVWEWISYFIPYFIMDVITSCWDWSWSILVKGVWQMPCSNWISPALGWIYNYLWYITNMIDWTALYHASNVSSLSTVILKLHT